MSAFVPVKAVGGAEYGGGFRVDLGDGRTLHVPASFDEGGSVSTPRAPGPRAQAATPKA